ncbi:ribonuclease HII [Candidatus Micrarchaeota archaeon]|nr:ribonuclease HII [Candidatus Micrarchaeota archaeon]
MGLIVGVDEAGRGCIIGPMVIGLAAIEQSGEHSLRKIGVRDSKKLSPQKRQELFPQVRKLCKTTHIEISAQELTLLMDKYSLNEIEAIKIAEEINAADYPKGTLIYIDSPDNIPTNFTKRIEKYLKSHHKIISQNKADDLHLIVGAASIVAKVTRDGRIEEIKKEIGFDFNSGYTSDPQTMEFVRRHLADAKLGKYLRHKWRTIGNLMQKRLADFEEKERGEK